MPSRSYVELIQKKLGLRSFRFERRQGKYLTGCGFLANGYRMGCLLSLDPFWILFAKGGNYAIFPDLVMHCDSTLYLLGEYEGTGCTLCLFKDTKYSDGPVLSEQNTQSAFVARISSDGDVDWLTTLADGGDGNMRVHTMVSLNTSKLIIGGSVNCTEGYLKGRSETLQCSKGIQGFTCDIDITGHWHSCHSYLECSVITELLSYYSKPDLKHSLFAQGKYYTYGCEELECRVEGCCYGTMTLMNISNTGTIEGQFHLENKVAESYLCSHNDNFYLTLTAPDINSVVIYISNLYLQYKDVVQIKNRIVDVRAPPGQHVYFLGQGPLYQIYVLDTQLNIIVHQEQLDTRDEFWFYTYNAPVSKQLPPSAEPRSQNGKARIRVRFGKC